MIDRQVVVEIVRQPAGELADRLHALNLAQPFLDLQSLRDVDAHRHGAAAQRPLIGDMQHAAVGQPAFGDRPVGAVETSPAFGDVFLSGPACRHGDLAALDGGT